MDMENFVRFVVIMFAVALFVVSAFLYFQHTTAPATSAMGFVFLLTVVLTISNYKRIKGFGFEAEMWDDKQKQAARLIDRLELLSKATSQQLALITSKLGLWSSGLSNPETASLFERLREILETTGTSDAERKNILAPLSWRIALNYAEAARQMVTSEVRKQLDAIQKTPIAAETNPATRNERIHALDETLRRLNQMSVPDMANRRTIQPLQELVSGTPTLADKGTLVNDLNEIANDISYFEANGRLRRDIDWSYVYK
jgi:hypothetical protein